MIPMGKNAVINNMSNVCNTIAFFFFIFSIYYYGTVNFTQALV